MKLNTNVIEKLRTAAAEIVQTARNAIRQSGESHPERIPLYMPIVIAGTDMRIVIECGPSIAASNAIHHAMGKAGQQPSLSLSEAIRRAGDLLSVHAERLKEERNDPYAAEYIEQINQVIHALQKGC